MTSSVTPKVHATPMPIGEQHGEERADAQVVEEHDAAMISTRAEDADARSGPR